MKVVVANDHRGRDAVEQVKAVIAQLGFECLDCTCSGDQPVDYPDTAYIAAKTVADGEADCAILICGTGIGMSIARVGRTPKRPCATNFVRSVGATERTIRN